MGYNALILDWDGNLADTMPDWLHAFIDTFAEYDLHPSIEEIASKVFGDWYGAIKVGLNPQDINEFSRKLIQKVNRNLLTPTLFPQIKETLEQISLRHIPMVLATSSAKDLVLPALKYHHIDHFFTDLLTGESVTEHKPHPEIIYKAMEIINSDKDHTVIVGDSHSDIGAGQAAGIATILHYPDSNQIFYSKELVASWHPTHTITQFPQILDVLDK